MGPEGLFVLLIQSLPTFWAERILILGIFLFLNLFGSQISLVKNIFRNLVPTFMGDRYFQECGPKILTCLQLVGTWVKIYFQECGPRLFDMSLESTRRRDRRGALP